MSSSVLVVVIVGAVICGIAYVMVRGAQLTKTGPQDATRWEPRAFADRPAGRPGPSAWEPPTLEPPVPMEPLPPARRFRAVTLLSVWVVVIGASAAALLGAVTFLAAHVINKALGS